MCTVMDEMSGKGGNQWINSKTRQLYNDNKDEESFNGLKTAVKISGI